MSPTALRTDNHFARSIDAAFPPAEHADTIALVGRAALRKLTNVARVSPKKSSDNPVREISDAVTGHNDASYNQRYRGEGMNNSNEPITRTNAERTNDWLQDVPQIKRRLSDALRADHGHKHSHLKLIAREAGASPRTVEKWTDAQYLPGLEHFLRLVPNSPSIQKMLAELMTLDPDTDPRHAVLLAQMQRQTR